MKFKTFSFKSMPAEGLAENEFAGYAAVFGNVDSDGDVIQKGAFTATIPKFLADGFIAWQHNWSQPIGKPIEAREDDHGLFIKARLSDVQQGREARILMLDDVTKKLSIGYECEAYSMLSDEQGALLLGEAEYQKAKADLPWYSDQIRLLTQINLFEVSPVSVPANDSANIMAAKGMDGFADLTHAKQAEMVGPIVSAYLKRTAWKAGERGKEKRKLSDLHIKTLTEMLTGFKASAKDLEALLLGQSELGSGEETTPPGAVEVALVTEEETTKAYAGFLRTSARMNGVAI